MHQQLFIKNQIVEFCPYDGINAGQYTIAFVYDSKSGMYRLYRLKAPEFIIANECELFEV